MSAVQNRCVRFVKKQRAELVECAWDASPPASDELTGRTLVSLISSGSERGGYMDYSGEAVYPMSTGYAVIMEVLAVGALVTGVKAGDLVFSPAPHCAYNRVKADSIARVPVALGPERAVMARIPAITMTSMVETRVRPTEPVAVAGLGIVGLLGAQVMQTCGYEVYCADPAPARRAVAQACGLKHVLASFDEAPQLKGRVGLGLECSGMEEATFALIDLVRKGGELSLIGVPWYRSTDADAHSLLRKIFYGYIHLRSGWEWSLPRHSSEFFPDSNYASFEKAMEWIASGSIKVEGIYQLESPGDCDRVYGDIARGSLARTCAIFDWRTLE